MIKYSEIAESILSCAGKLIVAGGYNGFSYADIADIVGIRKPSIHHHFPTKVDLVCSLMRDYRQKADAGLQFIQGRSDNCFEQLRSYVGYCLDGKVFGRGPVDRR